MRHKVYGKHLGRNKDERTALFKNLVQSLLLFEKIQTTEAKAKAIKGLVDKIINQAKSPTTRRFVTQFLNLKQIQEKLFKDLVPRLKDRNSGYTSIVKIGRRLGDGAMMVQMRLLASDSVKEAKLTKPKKLSVSKSKVAKEK